MIDEHLLKYLYDQLPGVKPLYRQIEQYASERNVPIMDRYSMETVLQILRIYQPKTILEIGSAIGYSALRMADETGAKVVTIERDEERFVQAEQNIARDHKEDQIVLIKGDAFEVVTQVRAYAPFDCIFIDAAKGQYQKFFELYTPFSNDRSLIITDNVLFKGYVYRDDGENKRLQKLGKKIDRYNDWLVHHPDYQTIILPVGDGIAISLKK
ncbi:O-methyltransferase [Bacillus andreraoultii]|uniref:O-methyltransferase n=1 Tax=Bacillus andreraoultii TaxID=1499685 RepID=UPI00053A4D0A|nr:O-methyltransferase [Bacillus andreraoultii]